MTLPAPVRRNLLLLVVCLAQLMVVLDVSIVNVALPSIRHDLGLLDHGPAVGRQRVHADLRRLPHARRPRGRPARPARACSWPAPALFTLASLLCAVADSQATLDGARALQGFGAAIISPATLAILTTSFTEGRERNRALAAWGAMGGVGGAAGVLLGGLLTQELELARDLPHQRAHRPRGHRRRPARRPRGPRPSSSTATSTSPARSSSPSGSPRWSTGSCAPTAWAGARPACSSRSRSASCSSPPSRSSRRASPRPRSCPLGWSGSGGCARPTS